MSKATAIHRLVAAWVIGLAGVCNAQGAGSLSGSIDAANARNADEFEGAYIDEEALVDDGVIVWGTYGVHPRHRHHERFRHRHHHRVPRGVRPPNGIGAGIGSDTAITGRGLGAGIGSDTATGGGIGAGVGSDTVVPLHQLPPLPEHCQGRHCPGARACDGPSRRC